MAVKILVLDTNALVKLFVDEPGHDVLIWLFNSSEPIMNQSLTTSRLVKDESRITLGKMVLRNQIPQLNIKGILERFDSRLRCHNRLRIFDNEPSRLSNREEISEDMQKFRLKKRNSKDCAILEAIVKHLRCFAGGSTPIVVTSDGDFTKVITAEGFRCINPEKMNVEAIKDYLISLDQ